MYMKRVSMKEMNKKKLGHHARGSGVDVVSGHIPAQVRTSNVRGLRLTDGVRYPVKVSYLESD